jgi:hypothetical protein
VLFLNVLVADLTTPFKLFVIDRFEDYSGKFRKTNQFGKPVVVLEIYWA